MPMDYDENDFHIHNVELAGEGSSTVLGPYDHEDSLQGQLRFDSLVENEVFLGITGQEDNQWIEEYSRGSSSSAAELRRNNVWSEATSSESVEMLLKSVVQGEVRVLGETMTQKLELELDASGSLAPTNKDPNLNQDDGAQEAIVTNKPQDNLSGSNESFKSHVTITTQPEEAKVSGGELDLVVLVKKCDLSVEKIDSICDNVNEEAKILAVESSKEEVLSTFKVDFTQKNIVPCKGDLIKTSSINAADFGIKNMETSVDNPTGSHTAVETCTISDENPCILESLDKSPFGFEGDIPFNEESTSLMPAGSCDFLVTEDCKACESSSSEQLCHGSKCAVTASPVPSQAQELDDHMHEEDSPVAVDDDNTKLEILASLESNLCSPSKVSDVQIRSIEEAENVHGKQAIPTASEGSDPSEMGEGSCINTSFTTNACSSAELLAGSILNMDLVSSNNTPKSHSGDSNDKNQIPAAKLYGSEQVNNEIRSSEQAGICIDQDVTFNEGVNARLPSDIAAHLDSKKNVESTSCAEGCKAEGSEAEMTILVKQVGGVKSDMVSSCDTWDGVHLHSGSVATDYEKTKEARFVSDGTCENESPEVAASIVDCASDGGALSVVEKGASPDGAGKVVHEASMHCASPVENIKSMMSGQAHEANHDGLGCSTSKKMMNPIPCDSPVKVGDNVETGGMQESISGHHREAPLSLAVNMSTEQQVSTDLFPPSECDDTDMRHDEDSCCVSPLNTELSQGTKVTHELASGSFPEVTKDMEGEVQSVSSNNDVKKDKSCTFEVSAASGAGQINKVPSLFPAIRACNVSTSLEEPCINSSSSIILDPRKSNESPSVTPQTPDRASIQVGNCERKTRRKSVGKGSVKKGKETTPRRVEKSSVLLSLPAAAAAACNFIQVDDLKTKKTFECSVTKPSRILLVPTTTKLPDLNNGTCIFQQPFTNNQQVQLRAQILVYGSLISGTAPEEPHMIAAFGKHGRLLGMLVWRGFMFINLWPMLLLLSSSISSHHQAEDIGAAVATKTYSESRTIKRKKVTTSPAVNETPMSRPVTALPVFTYLPPQARVQVLPTQGHNELAQNQTTVGSSLPTSVTKSTLVSESSPGRFPKTIPASSTHGYPRTGLENAPAAEILSKVEESKLQAENAALLAAAQVSNCQGVWSRLESQKISDASDADAKLMSTAVSIAAAAAAAKMAAAAAKIASNVADQARLMADEVLVSRKTENFDQSSSSSIVFSHLNNATPVSILRSVDHPNSIISAAREAARRRIEAASAASKHAENLDAIVKAAELAAEAVSQVGKIVAVMGNSSGYLQGEVSGKNVEAAAASLNEDKIQTMKCDPTSVIQMIDDGSVKGNENEILSKASKLPKAVGVAIETDGASLLHTYSYYGVATQKTSGIWEDHNIKEGCLVEVYKEDGKYKGAWLAANVLSLKDEEALVCYTKIQSSGQGSEKPINEWVALEVKGNEVSPRIRIPHPMTTMQFQGARKRRRTAIMDYAWFNGDRVDVWMHDCWREGIVIEPNKIDVTSLTVQFPAQGETSIIRSWHVRPTLIWKDRKWIEWSSLKGGHGSELHGETPKEKRMKLGTSAVKDKRKEKFPMNVYHVESRHEEPRRLQLSAEENCFNIGKTTNDENKLKSGLQKEGPRVIFGIPKPSKKQKFMDVSMHYCAADGSSKNKFSRYLKAQVPGWKTNDATENQVPETKSRRKPPVPSFRKITHNSLISSKSTTRDSDKSDDGDSVEKHTEAAASSSNKGDAAKKKASSLTPRHKCDHFNKRKVAAPPDGKKTQFKDKSSPQVNEPRRSNRKIQPTSRLLEGLQSSLTISKIPSFSRASQRSHNKVTSKGNTNRVDRISVSRCV